MYDAAKGVEALVMSLVTVSWGLRHVPADESLFSLECVYADAIGGNRRSSLNILCGKADVLLPTVAEQPHCLARRHLG